MQDQSKLKTFLSQHKTKIEIVVLIFLISILIAIITNLTADKHLEHKMTMCFVCKHKEVRLINPAKICNYKCKKCSSRIGIAWKCLECHYEFPVIEKEPSPSVKTEDYGAYYLEQTKCPNCGSYNTMQMLVKGKLKFAPKILPPQK